MATIGRKALAATTLTRVCTVGDGKFGRRLVICNRTTGAIAVRVGIVTAGSSDPVVDDYILYDTPISANTSVFLTNGEILLSGGNSLWAYAGSAGVSIRLME